jgi:hypothetical protein
MERRRRLSRVKERRIGSRCSQRHAEQRSAAQYRFSEMLTHCYLSSCCARPLILSSSLPPSHSHTDQNVISICIFGLFLPLFLLCLPCHLGAGIHMANLQAQILTAAPAMKKTEARDEQERLVYADGEERKY